MAQQVEFLLAVRKVHVNIFLLDNCYSRSYLQHSVTLLFYEL